jgi:hypothetical protein
VTYRLPGGRVSLTIDDGPFVGASVEVEPVGLWLVYVSVVGQAAKALAAESTAERFSALRKVYETFVSEALPSWDIEDHKGRVPPTVLGMFRLPETLALSFIEKWAETFVAEEEQVETAVDKLVPPGDLRDALNARLRSVA